MARSGTAGGTILVVRPNGGAVTPVDSAGNVRGEVADRSGAEAGQENLTSPEQVESEQVAPDLNAILSKAIAQRRVSRRARVNSFLIASLLLDQANTAPFTALLSLNKAVGENAHTKLASIIGDCRENTSAQKQQRSVYAQFMAGVRHPGFQLERFGKVFEISEDENNDFISAIVERKGNQAGGVEATATAYGEWVKTKGQAGDYGYTAAPRPAPPVHQGAERGNAGISRHHRHLHTRGAGQGDGQSHTRSAHHCPQAGTGSGGKTRRDQAGC